MNNKTSVTMKMRGMPRKETENLGSRIKTIATLKEVIGLTALVVGPVVEVEDVEGVEEEEAQYKIVLQTISICSINNHSIHSKMHKCNSNTTIKMLHNCSKCILSKATNNIIKVASHSISNNTNPNKLTMVYFLGTTMEHRRHHHLLHPEHHNRIQCKILNIKMAMLQLLRVIQYIMITQVHSCWEQIIEKMIKDSS